jgi:hypothetical protein
MKALLSIQTAEISWMWIRFAPILYRLWAKKLVSYLRLSQFAELQPHFFQDNVEIEALSRALQLNIDVAYLNGGRGDGVIDFIKFRHDLSSEAPPLILLYRYVHFLPVVCPI